MGERARVPARSDPMHHMREISRTVEQCAASPDGAPPGNLVTSSWQRCVGDYKLDGVNHKGPEIVTAQELKDAADPLELLCRVAKPEIDRLLARVAVANYVTILADPNGIALDVGSTMTVDNPMRRVGVCAGAVWNEALAGTNGIGTSITSRRAVTIHRNEHFFFTYAGLTCTAAPILDWNGNLIAALDASALADLPLEMQSFVLELVESTARRIERSYFLAQNSNRPILQIERRLDGVEQGDGWLLALGDDGNAAELLCGNGSRVRQLDHDQVIGRPLSDFMDITWQDIGSDVQDRPVQERIGIARLLGIDRPCFASLRVPKAKSGVKIAKQSTAASRSKVAAASPSLTLDELAGEDPALQAQVRTIKRLVDRRLPVLLQGETGTGKEEFARAIHNTGLRATGPFVAIDCSSIPEGLIESELFGYETGTFTGGRRDGRRGRISEAHGGTLFLDEIGDMPMSLQTRLLRVLAQRELVPLGALKPMKVDFNVICASHQDLPLMISEGRFRQDLYFRIAGIRCELPALRNRADKESVIQLALAIEAQDCAIDVPSVSDAAMQILKAHKWPGNIRELRLAMRYALAHAAFDEIYPNDLPAWLNAPDTPAGTLAGNGHSPVRDAEDSTPPDLAAVLDRHAWCITDAAADIGVSRQTLYRWMKNQSLVRPE